MLRTSNVRGVVVALGTEQTIAFGSTYICRPCWRRRSRAPRLADALGSSRPFSLALLISAVVGPWGGRRIDRLGGRGVLAASNLIFAAGLAALGLAQGPAMLFAAWAIIGLSAWGSGSMRAPSRRWRRSTAGGALSDHRHHADRRIRQHRGLAPVGTDGGADRLARRLLRMGDHPSPHRPAAERYPAAGRVAATQKPRLRRRRRTRRNRRPSAASSSSPPSSPRPGSPRRRWRHNLPRMLEAAGASTAAAIAAGALIGPAQVAARIADYGLLRRFHPLVSARIASLGHPVGAALLMLLGGPAALRIRAAAWGGATAS